MNQTAVDWLSQQILDNWNDIHYGARNVNELIIKAKVMEKEQMFAFTRHYHIIGEATNVFYKHEFEQYYNETYEQ